MKTAGFPAVFLIGLRFAWFFIRNLYDFIRNLQKPRNFVKLKPLKPRKNVKIGSEKVRNFVKQILFIIILMWQNINKDRHYYDSFKKKNR